MCLTIETSDQISWPLEIGNKVKGFEATCVESVTEMQKYFRLKGMLD